MRKALFLVSLTLLIYSNAWPSLELSTDNRAVDFGQMSLEEEKELGYLGGYHNEITCKSTNGITWYLKVNLVVPLASGANIIPLENFKWRVTSTDGRGTITSPFSFKEFSLFPDLMYISGPGDSSGTDIRLRVKYYLKIPEAQACGIYNTVIRFTLTEML